MKELNNHTCMLWCMPAIVEVCRVLHILIALKWQVALASSMGPFKLVFQVSHATTCLDCFWYVIASTHIVILP